MVNGHLVSFADKTVSILIDYFETAYRLVTGKREHERNLQNKSSCKPEFCKLPAKLKWAVTPFQSM
jgi:hypothetical protein